ncbi:hypothetical protein [Microbacterium sp.]|uniref:hypothetical protein n=1 Tax=Microbacterium sp. TaxID=51671 RepID=UPI002811BBDE|nr:hypothetical protein [Microbacterium sp.]
MSNNAPEHPVAGSHTDPTRVLNQPALRTSNGRIWIVSAGVFTAVCLAPLIGIIWTGGAAAAVAAITAVLLVGLFGAMITVHHTVFPGSRRLRLLAVCMLAMALVAFVGMLTCVLIVWAPIWA